MKRWIRTCPNCGEEITLYESELIGEDLYYCDCNGCNYTIEIEIEYNDNDNIIDLHVY